MKLNIGCGKKYELDYINIDLFEPLVADQLMSAINLTYEDNFAEEIKAIHLIEHLNFFEATYALSEFYRVLKPDKVLIIETPDLKKVCESYLSPSNEKKKQVLGWLYGIPHKGLQHKLCYPPSMLNELLENAGFENISISNFINDEGIPTIRSKCNTSNKKNDREVFHSISLLRKVLINDNKVDFTDSYLCKEQENVLSFIGSTLFQVKNHGKGELFEELIIELLIKWPEIVEILLSVIEKEDFKISANFSRIREIARILIEINFVNILYNSIKRVTLVPGTQRLAFYSVILLARKLIKDFLFSKGNEEYIKEKVKSLNHSQQNGIDKILSEILIERKALDQYYLGKKAFFLQDYVHAYNFFLKAIEFYRDNFKFYWYLAKTLYQLGSHKQANKFYKKTLRLLKVTNIKNKKEVKAQIQKEIKFGKINEKNL